MRLIKFLTALLLTAAFCYALNRSFPGSQSAIPALGQLFCPFTGFWQNAEGKSSLSDRQFNFPELSAPVKVYFDQRKVPHIFADNLKDAVCVQGYVTARDRLFQMDLSTRAAAGRLSEMLGARTLEFDKRQRRIGMVMAAENTLKNWEKNPDDLELIQSYVKGINTYISSLSPRDYPVEYKLLDFSPELWTPMRCALLMKNMDLTLCAREEDLETTNVLQALGRETFDYLYPLFNPKTSPIIPADREWDFEPLNVYNDSLSKPMFGEYRHRVLDEVPDNIGSNNWAVDGSKTASGNPILCNDPHLRLTLPSIWYEVQFHLAESNFYGVSLPGFPGVVIGFNKDIAWGMTNAALDLLDWYKIQWQDDQKSKYLYDGQVKEVLYKIEPYKVKGQADVMDTVRYTVWGPIAYDDPESSHYDLAIRWLPHQAGGSAVQTFKGLSKATNYDQYRSSLNNFRTPPQNIVFASKEGEIALTIQGQFPMRHPEQGRFVLDGSTSESAWKGTIPIKHNPSIRNPESGFVSSANQRSTGPSYPYNYHGRFSDYRGRYLNRRLEEMEKITVEDMMKLQNDNFSIKAEEALPLLIKYLESPDGHSNGSALLTELKNWDYRFERDQEAPTYFQIWWRNFYKNTWDEIYALQKEKGAIAFPESYRTIAIMEEDPESVFFDIQATDKKENISDIVRQSFGEMAEEIAGRTAEGQSNLWGDYRPAPIGNLARIPAFGVLDKRISGDKSALNANSNGAGPSWRMIVELGEEPRAFGVYPGGQSGNPGSPYYDSMLDYWAEGKYYELKFWQAAPSDNDEEVLFEETYSK